MKSQLNLLFEANMELELIQIDYYRVGFGISRHLFIPSNLIEREGDFARTKNKQKI